MTLGDRIHYLRTEKGYTLQELGDADLACALARTRERASGHSGRAQLP